MSQHMLTLTYTSYAYIAAPSQVIVLQHHHLQSGYNR